jgi:drug/metabolite transporter (DMT)-like permease
LQNTDASGHRGAQAKSGDAAIVLNNYPRATGWSKIEHILPFVVGMVVSGLAGYAVIAWCRGSYGSRLWTLSILVSRFCFSPVRSTVMAVILLRETITLSVLFGGVLVIAGTLVVAFEKPALLPHLDEGGGMPALDCS